MMIASKCLFVKLRFEKDRYLLTHLLCLQIFFSQKTIQMVPEMFLLLLTVILHCSLTTSAFACLV